MFEPLLQSADALIASFEALFNSGLEQAQSVVEDGGLGVEAKEDGLKACGCCASVNSDASQIEVRQVHAVDS